MITEIEKVVYELEGEAKVRRRMPRIAKHSVVEMEEFLEELVQQLMTDPAEYMSDGKLDIRMCLDEKFGY